MGIMALLVFGLLAGAIAQLVMPGPDGRRGLVGVIVTTFVGVIGAFVGGLIGSALGLGGVTGFNLGSLVLAIIGSVVLLAIWHSLAVGTRRTV